MSDMKLKMYVDDISMESFFDMRNAQPAKDKIHYFDTVLEGSIEQNSMLLQKLWTDVVSKSNIDFGRIPDSRGALIKYQEYSLMEESMDKLNKLYEGVNSDELTLMNKLHDLIIKLRKDFEFGYQFDIEILKLTYCTAVMALCELINLCILAYTKKLRNESLVEFSFRKVKKKDVIVIRSAKSLIKAYESGQWNKMMNDMRKDPYILSTSVATEASAISTGLVKFASLPNPAKISVAVIAALIVILLAVRGLIYLFYSTASKLTDYIKNQKTFVDITIKHEQEDGTSQTVLEKHNKLSQKLDSLATFIEVHVFKANADAMKALEDSNRDNYSVSDFKAATAFGGNVEF